MINSHSSTLGCGMGRRAFLAGGAAALSAMAGRPARPAAAGGPFSFAMLGDIHFDRPAHHDMAWLAQTHPADVHQVQEYTRISESTLPALLAEVRAAGADARPPLAFVLQVGDLVEGLCGSPELARRQCEEAVALVRDADLRVPFLFTKGNHDITGPGAAEAFAEVLLPFAARQAQAEPQGACFAYRQGEALFLFYDAYRPESLAWLERALAARPAGVRHVFLVIHPPVVPFDARALWHVYSAPKQQPERGRLLALLGKHRVIVLCGHLHEFGFLIRQTPEGPFAQLALGSVISRPDAAPKSALSGVQHYGPDLVQLEPQFDPKTEAARRESLAREAPFVRRYEFAGAPGYALLAVEGSSVNARLFAGLGRREWKTLDLTGALAEAGR